MRIFAPLVGLLLLSAVSAVAQEQPTVDCQNAVTQADMNICAGQDYDRADAELNKVYKQAVAATQAMDKELGEIDAAYVGANEALKKAQRAWIGYRDGQCELAGFEARGGSMEPMLVSGCLAELTRKRTTELKQLLEPSGN
ncbi:lysozyme inhibitor LprI family protein [Sinorhizobium psoraleae]|uniref:Lysozyme inhibitor LprI family protein n=1 Tax=Sinorhizobium psoraleae TaxID=520838 RepID=A0ABT4KIK5_9HYPH|nr:lysozyme inhibitor LprI family protein [Sinorhizobium psoraleae]MCZ4091805.1 lysozyme inhibitor LprI family protein [Sinorhizobium psoraleae]